MTPANAAYRRERSIEAAMFDEAFPMAEATLMRQMVLLMKRTGDRAPLVGRVYAPSKIAALPFPPLILLRLLTRRMSSSTDVLLFLLIYPRLCFERLPLWRSAMAERLLRDLGARAYRAPKNGP